MNKLQVIDSQFNTENVRFDDEFNSTFLIEKPLASVKEYLASECSDKQLTKKVKHNRTTSKNASVDSSLVVNNSLLESQNFSSVNKNLKTWGLPEEIAKKYEKFGIKEMFDWQVDCLTNKKVLLETKNLVYSAPTSAGKTLIAEILTIKTILERRKKVIIILPFVSIVREKTFYLQEILSSSGIRVEGFMGSQAPSGGLQAVHVAVCTIEKANSLINKLLEEGKISVLGALVVDELHLLGDPGRGYILELLLTKIRYVSSKFDDTNIQIIGMSATLPNLSSLAGWLEAELYITDFRPIPLDEYCLVHDTLYDTQLKPIAKLDGAQVVISDQSDIILKMCLDTIKDGCSVLIFCMTKNRCESLAQTLASIFYKLGTSKNNETGKMLRMQLKSDQISEVLQQLRSSPVGLDPIMTQIISFGVAYHHAGLSYEERDIIEGAFKSGAIRVLVATSTLSSGVNLPARKVIIRTPVFQKQPINRMTYKQMVGRAGRMGKDLKGESVLICSKNEKSLGFQLMSTPLDPVNSCLESGDKFMRAILEVIASETASTLDELTLYTKCTLYKHQNTSALDTEIDLQITLAALASWELIRLQTNEGNTLYYATSLGKACLSSSMGPTDAVTLFNELQKARRCLALDTDLHLVYMVTPFSVSTQWGNNIDWHHFWKSWEILSPSNKMVAQLVGVTERFLCNAVRNKINYENLTQLNIHKRFYTALALQDLINEVPLSEVANKFQCSRGFLQSLQQGAATFAGMVTAFCHQLGWKNMELLVSQFQDRLNFGVNSELIELMKLPSLNGARARTLFDKGFETIADVASADVNVLENILYRSIPFESNKNGVNECKRKQTKHVWVTGCRGMTVKELAENLVTEARKHLIQELKITDAKWVKREFNDCNESLMTIHNPNVSIKQESYVSENKNDPVDQSDEKSFVSKSKENPFVDKDIKFGGSNYDADVKEIEKKRSLHLPNVETLINQIDSSINNLYSDNSVNKNKPTINKDEIIWDSIEITDSAIQNITKTRLSDKLFSPDISFGETQETLPENIDKCLITPSTSISAERKDITKLPKNIDKCLITPSTSISAEKKDKTKLPKNIDECLITPSTSISAERKDIAKLPKNSDKCFITPSTSISAERNDKKNLPKNIDKCLITPSTSISAKRKDITKLPKNIDECLITPSTSISAERKDITKLPKNIDECLITPSTSISAERKDITKLPKNIDKCLITPSTSISAERKDTTKLPKNIDESSTSLSNTVSADLTLFSDEDNSLIDASLPLDLIPSKLLDCKDESIHNNLPKSSHLATDCFSMNSNTLLKEFNSTEVIETDISDEDIKLVYEDDKQIFVNENLRVKGKANNKKCKTTKAISSSLKTDNDIEKQLMMTEMIKSLMKTTDEPLTKRLKIGVDERTAVKNDILNRLTLIGFGNLKDSLFYINKAKLMVVALRGTDIVNNFHVIEAFSDVALYLHTKPKKIKSKGRVIGAQILNNEKEEDSTEDIMFELLKGIALYFGKDLCIYLDLQSINKTERMSVKETISKWLRLPKIRFRMLSLKIDYLCLKKCFEADISGSCEDVLYNEWLINNCEMFPNIQDLIKKCFEGISSDLVAKELIETKLLSMDSAESAIFMAFCIWTVVDQQKATPQYKIMKDILGIEQRVAIILANCEYYGIALHKDYTSVLLEDVQRTMDSLRLKAFKILGRKLNFNSREDVAKSLRLNTNSKAVCTNKVVLAAHNSPLASIVIYWRKLNSILTHTLYPLAERAHFNNGEDEEKGIRRISPRYTMYTSTGRISMEQPNLQCVPRPFSIPLSLLDGEQGGELKFNCRRLFRAASGYVLVSADYCQLEMRILTHFCRDEILTSIMRSEGDVFKSIAAQWSDKPEDEVDEDDRQRAKQLCYGIIYGIGFKVLAKQLDIVDSDAIDLMASFHQTYPAIMTFTNKVVEMCRKNQKVETLMKRSRFLPDLNSKVLLKRQAAQRKAVNTTIQGTAADIVKAAMVKVDDILRAENIGARLILQLHDELIYEVPQEHKLRFARLLKSAMENTVTLRVPLPVKLKTGETWGSLEDL